MALRIAGVRPQPLTFQAANPGCILADFVRWHSPRDWITEPEEESGTAVGCVGGRLSERMTQPGNIWESLWKKAPAQPVCKQRALFDCAKEAGVCCS